MTCWPGCTPISGSVRWVMRCSGTWSSPASSSPPACWTPTGCWPSWARSRRACPCASARCAAANYRDRLAELCFSRVLTCGDVSLVLYDVTTLYFEAEHEDGLRKVGYSKERRVDPQIVVGLLVDRHGFPLEIGCFEGNQAEKLTILPVIRQFQARHGL